MYTLIYRGVLYERKRMSKYTRKCANVFELLDVSSYILSLSGGGAAIRSFIPLASAPIRFIAWFITLFFMTSNNLVQLF